MLTSQWTLDNVYDQIYFWGKSQAFLKDISTKKFFSYQISTQKQNSKYLLKWTKNENPIFFSVSFKTLLLYYLQKTHYV